MKLETSASIQRKFTFEIQLEDRYDVSEIEVLVGFEWDYECNPDEIRGTDFLVISEVIWDCEGFTWAEEKEIQAAIFSRYEEWTRETEEAEREGRLNVN
jgi:hypothetical protein